MILTVLGISAGIICGCFTGWGISLENDRWQVLACATGGLFVSGVVFGVGVMTLIPVG